MKRSVVIAVHTLCVLLTLAALVMLRSYTVPGEGVDWIQSESFEDSPQFSEMVGSDVAGLKRLAVLKAAFEDDGELDEERMAVSASSQNGRISYTFSDIVTMAKRYGYVLDESHNVSAVNAKDPGAADYQIKVDYKSYDPYYFDNIEPGPSQGVMRIDDLCLEVLRAYSEYFALSARYETEETNFKYYAEFEDVNGEVMILSNTELLPINTGDFGRYLRLTEDFEVETNINPVPANVLEDTTTFGYSGNEGDHLCVAVDTMYLFPDRYKAEADSFNSKTDSVRKWLICFAAAGLLSLISLIFVVGDRESAVSGRVFVLDKLPVEVLLILTGAASALIYLLLRPALQSVLQTLVNSADWPFWFRLSKSVVIYAGCVVIMCSMYRRTFSGGVFSNSLTAGLINEIIGPGDVKGWRLFLVFGAVILINVCGAGAAAWFISRMGEASRNLPVGLMIAAFILVFDVLLYLIILRQYTQRSELNKALKRISGGELDYEIPEENFSGGELEAARSINSISEGLKSALSEQVRADRLKTDLITNVSHDIKTPLTSIINYVDLIKRENPENDRIRDYIDVLDKKSARLKNLIEDLIEASKASSGNVKLEMSRLNMSELAEQAGGEFGDRFAANNLEFVLTVHDNPAFVSADGRHLWRVFENLYSNAAKYALAGTRVYADVKHDGRDQVFSIKNVSAERLNISPDELTERFIRGDASRHTEGSGLGLSIAKSLTELMGGRLVIEIDGDLYKASVIFPEYEGDGESAASAAD